MRSLSFRVVILVMCVVIAIPVVLLGGSVALMHVRSHGRVTENVSRAGADGRHAAIVLGAGLEPDGTPSALLGDRVRAGVKLLEQGRAQVLIMSGDNRRAGYDEPTAMIEYAHSLGAPQDKLVPDYAGRRTYDSCWRARHVFGLTSATVVTSGYHAPRAVFLCRSVGVDADALAVSDGYFPLRDRLNWHGRETAASLNAILGSTVRSTDPASGAAIDPFDPCAVWKATSAEDRVGASPCV